MTETPAHRDHQVADQPRVAVKGNERKADVQEVDRDAFRYRD